MKKLSGNFNFFLFTVCVFFGLVTLIFNSRPTDIKNEYSWEIVNNAGVSQIFLTGKDVDKLNAAEINFSLADKNDYLIVRNGGFITNSSILPLKNKSLAYLYIKNPGNSAVDRTKPILEVRGNFSTIDISPSSQIYISENGVFHPITKIENE